MNDSTEGRVATVLGRAIARGQAAEVDGTTVLWVLAASDVVILNESDDFGNGFPDSPLVLSDDRGELFLALFTHQDMARSFAEGRVPVRVPAFEILRRLPATSGILVNPGNDVGLQVPAEGARAFVLSLVQG